ncbi:MAG: NAD-binding protein, partial [Oscillospiraceae bacterium]|nr:NAD-binding protein [Oscillospiraceae bacterium]
MQRVTVIGAGTMGLDIAQVFASAGKNVTVVDISEVVLQKAAQRLEKGLAKRVERGKLAQADKDALLSRIAFDTDRASAKDADLVVEAIIENIAIKKELFAALDAICPAETIFATNTSSISITEIASATGRADRFIGMHFFNPATVMKLIELIRGMATSDATFEA